MDSAKEREQVLFSYVEMCYSVALVLTRNPYDARDLTRDVVTWAWHLRDSAGGKAGIKRRLLMGLRERFLHHHRHRRSTFGNKAGFAERI